MARLILAFIVAPFATVPVTVLYFVIIQLSGAMDTRDVNVTEAARVALAVSAYGVVIAAAYTLVFGTIALLVARARKKPPTLLQAGVLAALVGTLPWLYLALQNYGVYRGGPSSPFMTFAFLPLLALLCSVAVAETFWWVTFGSRRSNGVAVV